MNAWTTNRAAKKVAMAEFEKEAKVYSEHVAQSVLALMAYIMYSKWKCTPETFICYNQDKTKDSRKAGGIIMNSRYTEIDNTNKEMFLTGCFHDEPLFKCLLCEKVVSLDNSVSNKGSNLICAHCFRLYFNGKLKNFEKWANIKTYRFTYTVNDVLKNALVKSDSLEDAVKSLTHVFELKKDYFNIVSVEEVR